MKSIAKLSLVLALAAAVSLMMSVATVFAQKSAVKTDGKMLYHNGPVINFNINVYFIYYGCWNCGFPGSDFLIQQNWVNGNRGYCALLPVSGGAEN